MNKVSLNLDRFLDEELEVRGKLVNQCRVDAQGGYAAQKVTLYKYSNGGQMAAFSYGARAART